MEAHRARHVVEETDHPDRGRRKNRDAVRFVVERHVAGDDRRLEGPARFRQTANRGRKLAEDLGTLGVPEVEAVRDGEGLRADAGEIQRGLGDRVRGPRLRVLGDVSRVHVTCHGEALRGARHPDDRRVAAGARDRVRPHAPVVLRRDPALAAEVRRREEREKGRGVVRRSLERDGRRGRQDPRKRERAAIERSRFDERRDLEIGDDGAFPEKAHARLPAHDADRLDVDAPFAEDGGDLGFPPLVDDEDHPLLRFGEHQLVRRHPGLAHRNLREVELHPDAAARAHLERGGRQPRRAHVLDGDDGVTLEHLEDGLEHELLDERVAHLYGGPALGLGVVEHVRGHGCAMDPVAARFRARVEDGIPGPRGLRAEDPILADEADRHRVDEDVLVVGGVKEGHPADRRNADAVAVAADSAHDTVDEVAHARGPEVSEKEPVEDRERTGAHREDVAQNSAHTRGRALIRLDERRVVVGLHLEDDGETVADVHGPGVLARTLQHARARRRELPQEGLRRLVRAVLTPKRRVNAEFHEVRLAAQDFPNLLELVRREPMLGHDGRGQGGGHIRHGARSLAGQAPVTPPDASP